MINCVKLNNTTTMGGLLKQFLEIIKSVTTLIVANLSLTEVIK